MTKLFFIVIATIFSLSSQANLTLISGKYDGDCFDMLVRLKNINGAKTLHLQKGVGNTFSATAPRGFNTVTRECLATFRIQVPANTRLAINPGNPADMGLFHAFPYVYDNQSSINWDVSWDLLNDRWQQPYQNAGGNNYPSTPGAMFGDGIAKQLPIQFSKCFNQPRIMEARMLVTIEAHSSERKAAAIHFNDAYLYLKTSPCQVIGPLPRRR